VTGAPQGEECGVGATGPLGTGEAWDEADPLGAGLLGLWQLTSCSPLKEVAYLRVTCVLVQV
jgi:hypothetical protein